MYKVYKLAFLCAVIALAIVFYNSYHSFLVQRLPTQTISIAGHDVQVEVANTELTRAHGLSDRESLAKDTGMLFVFPVPGFYEFWMKDMHFSIDMIWVDKDHTIVSINQDVAPDTYPGTFSPENPALYVIEVPAGYAKNYAITAGDVVTGL